jgi:hypothetical protein
MGIKGVAYKWFENYLKGRSQKVDVNGRTNFKLVLPHSFRKVKNENLKGEFARSQRSFKK